MKKIIIILTLFSISCKGEIVKGAQEQHSSDKRIKDAIYEVLNNIQNQLVVDLDLKKISNDELVINFTFNRNKVVHPNHQKVLISYILNEVEIFSTFNKIKINYNVEQERDFNQNNIQFSKKDLILIKEIYEKQAIYKKLIEYSLKNFTVGSPFALDIWVENVNSRYPEDTLGSDFFNVIEMLSEECSGMSQRKDAKVTLVIMSVALKSYIENGQDNQLEPQDNILQIISDLWEICEGEKIEFAEQRLFGQVGGNW